jgi:hypothetical protein
LEEAEEGGLALDDGGLVCRSEGSRKKKNPDHFGMYSKVILIRTKRRPHASVIRRLRLRAGELARLHRVDAGGHGVRRDEEDDGVEPAPAPVEVGAFGPGFGVHHAEDGVGTEDPAEEEDFGGEEEPEAES